MVDDTKRRRRELAIRFFTYGVMTIAVIFGVIFCVAWAMGYRIDLKSGQLSQVALLQFNTYPTGATVTVNNKKESTRTPTRANVQTGQIKLTMSRDGYHTWQKTVTTKPSTVRWLDYVRLVPNKISTESVRSFSSVSQMVAAPNRKWLVLVTDTAAHSLTLADVSDAKNVKVSELKYSDDVLSPVPEGASEKFRVIEWDDGSRYLIIEHAYGDQIEYLRVDRQDAARTINLTREFGMNMREVHFSGNSGNLFYALTDNDIRRFDYGGKSVSAPVAQDVQRYQLYGDNKLIYVTRTERDGKVTQTVALNDDGNATEIKHYDDDQMTRAAYSEYNSDKYVAIAHGNTVQIYTNPMDDAAAQGDDNRVRVNNGESDNRDDVVSLKVDGQTDWLRFNPNGRMVYVGRDKKIYVHDTETNEDYHYDLAQSGEPYFIDDYHVLDIRDGAVTMLDFDGSNAQHIVSGRLPAALSNDNKYLFSLDSISGGVVLQRSNMTI